MNYIGRLVTNVRGFYSEINSATLTGAIDIVVIRNEDGSFTGSPFHVRFGKLGVLRSREKIVDIEINGESVPLQMKLGEAGEAFFVREVDDDSVPMSLSTSPIPSSHQIPIERDTDIRDTKKEDIREGEPVRVEEEEKSRRTETGSSNDLEDVTKVKDTDPKTPDRAGLAVEKTGATEQNEDNAAQDVIEPVVERKSPQGDQDVDVDDQSDSETNKEHIVEPREDVPDGTRSTTQTKEEDGDADLEPENYLSVSSPPKSDSIPIPGRRRDTPEVLSDTESPWPESGTPERHDLGHQFYPFSDLDTPVGSPSSGSPEKIRPSEPQKYLSDTEIEINQGDCSVEDELSWTWGKLPKAPKVGLQGERKPSDHTRTIDSSHAHKAKRKEALSKISHKARGEGMYLDDLNALDHEIASLYLNQALSSRGNQNSLDDHESGIGQSLPCSPSNEEISKEPCCDNIAISLCGELRNGKVAQDRFLQNMVSYENFCADPSLLSNPKLVIRINDRYFNWQIAAPMLMSQLIFQRPLSQEATKSLMKQHMPKKEKRRTYSYWFTWRANYDDKSSDEEDDELMKKGQHQHQHQHRPRAHTLSSRHHQPAVSEIVIPERPRTVSDYTSGNESDPSSLHYKKVIRLTSDQLASLNLKEGANTATFSVTTKYQGTASCSATIYLWNFDDKIVISDIDGTITKSDVLGQILPQVGMHNWAQSGVAHFFTAIQNNGYKLLYLSARAIGQAQQTRDYLKSVKQDQTALPGGPLLLSPESLIKAFHREVIEKKPEEFKIACLRDIQSLFPNGNPFHAGFGNKINDALAYRTVGVSVSRIFTINHKGEVRHELTNTFQTSYLKLSVLVDQMFPPYKSQGHRPSAGLIAPEEFSSFIYWRPPVEKLSNDELDSVLEEEEGSKQ